MYCSLGPKVGLGSAKKKNKTNITNSIFNSVFKHIHISRIITVFFTFVFISETVCLLSQWWLENVPNLDLSTKDNIRSPNRISNDVKLHKGSLRGGDSVSQIWLHHIVWCSELTGAVKSKPGKKKNNKKKNLSIEARGSESP